MSNYSSNFEDWSSEEYKDYSKVTKILMVLYAINQVLKIIPLEWTKISNIISLDSLNRILDVISPVIHIVLIVYVMFRIYKWRRFSTGSENQVEMDYEYGLKGRLCLSKKGENNEEDNWEIFKNNVNNTLKQFVNIWTLLWVFWLPFYFILPLKIISHSEHYAFQILQNLFNNLSTLMFIYLYLTLTKRTVEHKFIFWVQWAFLVIGVALIETFICVVFWETDKTLITFLTQLISGLFSSVALMATFGRLNSKFINMEDKHILILYAYGAMQCLYCLLGIKKITYYEIHLDISVISNIILIFAFIGKVYLFMIISWLLRTDRMTYYIVEETSLNLLEGKNFEDFSKGMKLEDE